MKKLFIIICFLFGSVLAQAYENNLISFLQYCKDTSSDIEIVDRKAVGEAAVDWGVYVLLDGQRVMTVYGKTGRLVVTWRIKKGAWNKANIAALNAGDPYFKATYEDDGSCRCVLKYTWEADKSKSAEELNWTFGDVGNYVGQTVSNK